VKWKCTQNRDTKKSHTKSAWLDSLGQFFVLKVTQQQHHHHESNGRTKNKKEVKKTTKNGARNEWRRLYRGQFLEDETSRERESYFNWINRPSKIREQKNAKWKTRWQQNKKRKNITADKWLLCLHTNEFMYITLSNTSYLFLQDNLKFQYLLQGSRLPGIAIILWNPVYRPTPWGFECRFTRTTSSQVCVFTVRSSSLPMTWSSSTLEDSGSVSNTFFDMKEELFSKRLILMESFIQSKR
jgi:hypothetical protein